MKMMIDEAEIVLEEIKDAEVVAVKKWILNVYCDAWFVELLLRLDLFFSTLRDVFLIDEVVDEAAAWSGYSRLLRLMKMKLQKTVVVIEEDALMMKRKGAESVYRENREFKMKFVLILED